MKHFDLNLLKTLEALIDTGSVTKAAGRLGLSQPAVSGMLVRLREAFADPLFVRAPRGLVPTPRTLELADDLRRLLAEIGALAMPSAFDFAHSQRTFRVAATDYAQAVVVVALLKSIRNSAPGIRLAVRPVGPHFADQLANDELDLALVTPTMAPDTLRSRKLFDEDYVCVLRQDHPNADRLDLRALCELDHAIMSHDGSQFSGATDVALAKLGQMRRVVAALPSFLVLVELVRVSDVVCFVPRRLACGIPGIVATEPPLAIDGFQKIAVWHERAHHDPASRWLREQLIEVASRMA